MARRARRSLGIDVSGKPGLDLVLFDGSKHLLGRLRRVPSGDLARWLTEWSPDVVAIDSPHAWGALGGSRKAERELQRLGIKSYASPSDPRKREQPCYGWMEKGFEVFEVCAAAGYPRYRKGRARRHALEVFSHASAVVLAGGLPPASSSKRAWRADVLRPRGIDAEGLRLVAEQVDAALAALTGLLALGGDSCAVGDPAESVIVLPCREVPTARFRRCTEAPRPAPQPHLPGLSPCACGDPECREVTSGEFAIGHIAKRKSRLWEQARAGEEAVAELKRRGWELPPEQR
jgi:predicted nuclease with RNAse H fold